MMPCVLYVLNEVAPFTEAFMGKHHIYQANAPFFPRKQKDRRFMPTG